MNKPMRGKALSAAEAKSLVESADTETLLVLMADDTAELAEEVLQACLDQWPSSNKVHAAMIARRTLPAAVVLRLFKLVPGDLRRQLVTRHPLPAGLDARNVELTRERPGWWSRQIRTYFD